MRLRSSGGRREGSQFSILVRVLWLSVYVYLLCPLLEEPDVALTNRFGMLYYSEDLM